MPHYPKMTSYGGPKPDYKGCVQLSDGTLVGQVYPMKFRIRRKKTQCFDCDRDLYLRETVTDSSNLLLLSNCCSVEVYPKEKMDNWHCVPVGMISGQKHFSKKIVSEICQLEAKEEPPAPVQQALAVAQPPPKKKKKKKKKK
ncbi:hypothetical protein KR222_011824, partial [Zaprionus bogoriensis]